MDDKIDLQRIWSASEAEIKMVLNRARVEYTTDRLANLIAVSQFYNSHGMLTEEAAAFVSRPDFEKTIRRQGKRIHFSPVKPFTTIPTPSTFVYRPLVPSAYADEETLLSSPSGILSKEDNEIYLLQTGALLSLDPTTLAVNDFLFPDLEESLPESMVKYKNRIYAASSGYNIIEILDLDTKRISVLSDEYTQGGLHLHKNLLIAIVPGNRLQVWNLDTMKFSFVSLYGPAPSGRTIHIDGNLLYASSKSVTLVYDLANKFKLIRTKEFDRGAVTLNVKNGVIYRFIPNSQIREIRDSNILSAYDSTSFDLISSIYYDGVKFLDVYGGLVFIVCNELENNTQKVLIADRLTLKSFNDGDTEFSTEIEDKVTFMGFYRGVLYILTRRDDLNRAIITINPMTLNVDRSVSYQGQVSVLLLPNR
jgi:hypothetical protein